MTAALTLAVAAAAAASHPSAPPPPAGWLTEQNADAMYSGSMICKNLPHMMCVGSLASAAACEDSCGKAHGCAVWTWSEHSHHCWHRTDHVWAPKPAAGIVSGCDQTTLGTICALPPAPAPVSPHVNVSLGSAGGEVSPNSPAVALDWWVKEDPKYGFQWGDASILVLDLENPKLLAYARALAPAVLRLGGSPIDSIEYAIGPEAEKSCARGKGSAGGAGGNTCSQCGLANYGCLTGERWRALLAFGKATQLRILLGLNACNGRKGKATTMNFTNIQSLLSFTASLPKEELSALAGFEFGNEILNTAVEPSRWAHDANHLAGMIRSTFKGAGLTPPPR